MFDLFGDFIKTNDPGLCKFYVKEDVLTEILRNLNSFNVADMNIVNNVPKEGFWRIEFKTNPDVVRAIRKFLSGKVIWEIDGMNDKKA